MMENNKLNVSLNKKRCNMMFINRVTFITKVNVRSGTVVFLTMIEENL